MRSFRLAESRMLSLVLLISAVVRVPLDRRSQNCAVAVCEVVAVGAEGDDVAGAVMVGRVGVMSDCNGGWTVAGGVVGGCVGG